MLKDIQKRGGTIRQKVTMVEMVEMEESLPTGLKANQIKDLQGRNMALKYIMALLSHFNFGTHSKVLKNFIHVQYPLEKIQGNFGPN